VAAVFYGVTAMALGVLVALVKTRLAAHLPRITARIRGVISRLNAVLPHDLPVSGQGA